MVDLYEKGEGGNSLINHYFAAKKWVACLQIQKLMVFEMWNDKHVLGEISKNVLKADMNVRFVCLQLLKHVFAPTKTFKFYPINAHNFYLSVSALVNNMAIWRP